MLPIKTVYAPPTTDLGQRYRAHAAGERIKDALTDVESEIAELLKLQNMALSRIDHLIAQSGARADTHTASANDARHGSRAESFKNDMTRCESCANVSNINNVSSVSSVSSVSGVSQVTTAAASRPAGRTPLSTPPGRPPRS